MRGDADGIPDDARGEETVRDDAAGCREEATAEVVELGVPGGGREEVARGTPELVGEVDATGEVDTGGV